jgi:beta-xylosidase
MIFVIFKRLSAVILLLLSTSVALADSFPKVILPGDYADPSIMRDGKDYYMTHSSFYYSPGFLIWHSQDLVNWEPVTRALTQIDGSAWAPEILKYKGRYYIYYPSEGSNYVIYADDIRGPWSKPIDLKVKGIDPGHLVDKDGNRWLYVSGGGVIQLAPDGLSTVGEMKWVYQGWDYPEEWETECKCQESPKLIYKDGYYYMVVAEGGTAGPATSHMVVAARAKSPLGPWENSPYNPIVHTYSASEAWWSKGHGTLIDDVNGNWWIVYHAYAKNFHSLGRQTLIEPIEWTEDGWFRTKSEASFPKAEIQVHHGMELSDDFMSEKMGLQWAFYKEYAPEALTIGKGTLSMRAKGKTIADARLLHVMPIDYAYTAEVTTKTNKGNAAGMAIYYNELAYAGVMVEEDSIIVYTNVNSRHAYKNQLGKKVTLRLENNRNSLSIAVSKNGKEWTTLASDIDISQMNHNNYGGFMAQKVALVSAKDGTATFSKFKYYGMP